METGKFLKFLDVLTMRHDPYENGHAENSAILMKGLAEATGYPKSKLEDLLLATRLHDVGKLLIPENILNKQGKLTVEEIAAIHRHSLIGYDAVLALNLNPIISQAILEHHENWDGTGYPYGLRGEKICIEARMIAICDSFEALTSNRSYRLALDSKSALEIMGKMGLDPDLFEIFVKKVVQL